ncbi:MAG: UDP-N-acetylglucosamine 1-carboxyvinyltransferase [Anaerovoracaceae bacterium]
MESYHIQGGSPIEGTYSAKGAKNAALPIFAATIAVPGIHHLSNCPNISDLSSMYCILKELGATIIKDGSTVTVDSTKVDSYKVPTKLMKEMRSSVFLMGALLSRCGEASICKPGGCKIGKRPIDIHITALEQLGYKMIGDDESINFKKEHLNPGIINLPFPSVGATENIILASIHMNGIVTIKNCAKEPEIVDLVQFLNKCGAQIIGAGTGTIYIVGTANLYSADYDIMGDRIEAATYLMAAAGTKGCLEVNHINPRYLMPVTTALEKMGCKIIKTENKIVLQGPEKLKSCGQITTGPYSQYPTDCQPQLMSLCSVAKGKSVITETIFENRFAHGIELNKMGGNIEISQKNAIINGVDFLHGENVESKDLRGGAALIIAGLMAEGETNICGIQHICRGYEDIDKNLKKLGGKIERISD